MTAVAKAFRKSSPRAIKSTSNSTRGTGKTATRSAKTGASKTAAKSSALKKSSAAKTSRIAYGVRFLLSNHPEIRRVKRESEAPSIHGNKFWGSSYLLMDYLKKHPLKPGTRVLELGCGWGLAGIYCAKRFDAVVTGVDADDAVFPYLQLHAQENGVSMATKQAYFEKLSTKFLSQFDVIIGADICFWDELADKLYSLTNRAVRAGVQKIVLADPERSPFFDLAERCTAKHCAELTSWAVNTPRRASGSLLIIENA